MKLTELLHKANLGLKWNALYYIVYQSFATVLSFTLFYAFTTHDFSLWANINSAIYLLLLWLDLGLSRSLARYTPSFSNHPTTLKKFVRTVLLVKSLILLFATPLLCFLIQKSTSALGLHAHFLLCVLGALIFLSEGAVSVVKRLYHAQFWHKEFNVMSATIMSARMCGSLFLAWLLPMSSQLLIAIFVIKLSESALIVLVGIIRMASLSKSLPQKTESHSATAQASKEFIAHSAMMWSTTTAKSLSERNFLVPLFTYFLGPLAANSYKVANDAALLFQRFIIKTIGTVDTSVLTHAGAAAFTQITKSFIAFVVPLASVLALLFFNQIAPGNEHIGALFYLLASCYLLEIIFIPYERLLEVERNYALLFWGHVPYLLIMALALGTPLVARLGILSAIGLVFAVRLCCSLIMAGMARAVYRVRFPYAFFRGVTTVCVGATAILLVVIRLLSTLHN